MSPFLPSWTSWKKLYFVEPLVSAFHDHIGGKPPIARLRSVLRPEKAPNQRCVRAPSIFSALVHTLFAMYCRTVEIRVCSIDVLE